MTKLLWTLLLLIPNAQVSGLTKRDTPCPVNCFECEDGSCSGCNSRWYGVNCSKECPSGCPRGCKQETGECLCDANKYGPTCSQDCPQHCQDVKCNSTGYCDGGCKNGFYGERCNKTCGHCSDEICVQDSGVCSAGCLDTWEGDMCTVKYLKTSGFTTSSLTSGTTMNTSQPSRKRASATGPSKQTIDLIIGITFGVFVLAVFLFICFYFHRQKCTAILRRKNNKEEPMYETNDLGSPMISRSYSMPKNIDKLDEDEEKKV